MKNKNNNDDILQNSNTLLVFLFLKTHFPKSFGIREIMRGTKLRSSSTVSRQLDRLEKANLVTKDSTNKTKYQISELGQSMKKLDVHVTIPVSLSGRFLVTNFLFQITFIAAFIIIAFIFIWFDVFYSALLSLLGLVIGLILIIYRWIQIRKQLQDYRF